jgi:hypothetical protein
MNYDHDVAFSFLTVDEHIAIDLNERLKPALRTFLYTEYRKDLLGAGGYEKYARVFRSKETYNREWLIARPGYRSPAPAASGICAHAGGAITLTALSTSRGGRRTLGVEMESAARNDSLRHGTGRALLRAPDEHDGRE